MNVQNCRTRIHVWTPAKLNLFLEICGRRADGFHELETLMIPIALCDHLVVSQPTNASDGSLSLTCDYQLGHTRGTRPLAWSSTSPTESNRERSQYLRSEIYSQLPESSDNLVSKAIDLLRAHTGCTAPLAIQLRKSIPAASGLGGGSSDAAAALFAANSIWGLGLGISELSEIAGQVGSDVPFFLFGSPCFCTGRGEQINVLPSVTRPLYFVVVRPPQGLSTAEVYRRNRLSSDIRSSAAIFDALNQGHLDQIGRAMFNRLEEPAREISPWIRRVSETFSALPVVAHQMSGSGSAYFALCRNRIEARRVAATLVARGVGQVFAAKSASFRQPFGSKTLPSQN